MLRFESESEAILWFYPIILVLSEKSRLLVSWCVGDRCGMAGNDDDLGSSRRPGAEDRGWPSTCRVLGGQMIGRSGDIVYGLYHTQGDEEHGFLG
jgi:hypothetical protein